MRANGAGPEAGGAAPGGGGVGARPRVFTVPNGADFLAVLVEAVLAGDLVPGSGDDGGPFTLADTTIYVPTRRAARALRMQFAERFGLGARLLPRLVPLGDAGEQEVAAALTGALANAETLPLAGGLARFEASLPPATSELERRLTLARLALHWKLSERRAHGFLPAHESEALPSDAADSLSVAGDLAGLMDAMRWEDVPVARLDGLVTEDAHGAAWALTTQFLRIAFEAWPKHLAERGGLDPTDRAVRLLRAEVARIETAPPRGPVIVAGSAGSKPATRALIRAVARSPRGAVVLPGLDTEMDERSWSALLPEGSGAGSSGAGSSRGTPSHPQAALARLLRFLGVHREEVTPLAAEPLLLRPRMRFVREALRPAETTHTWTTPKPGQTDAADPLKDVAIVEAPDEGAEALAIAVALREAVEDPNSLAALVTPDRALAERVAAELTRWGVGVDDSAGQPLSRTPHGSLARLVCDAACSRFDAVTLAALLAHPLLTLGRDADALRRARAAADHGALRGLALVPRPEDGARGGIAAARRALARARAAAEAGWGEREPLLRRRLTPDALADADALLADLSDALGPFCAALDAGERVDLVAAARLAVRALDALTLLPPEADEDGDPAGDGDGDAEDGEPLDATRLGEAPPPPPPAFGIARGAAGEVFAAFADELDALPPEAALEGLPAGLPRFVSGLLEGWVVPPPAGGHRRVRILGLLEARLLRVDFAVLGGLDEGVWPGGARSDAFLSRPMRAEIGLPAPEARIGEAAHDFLAALGAPRVMITRAAKRGGSPTVPSRFFERMRALGRERIPDCEGLAREARRARGEVEEPRDPARRCASEACRAAPRCSFFGRARATGDVYLALGRALDRRAADGAPAAAARVGPPAPRPPLPLVRSRLARFSVTQVERLVRDPYAIYAQRILQLEPARPYGEPLGAALRGTVFHDALARFAAATVGDAEARAALHAHGREAFAQGLGENEGDPSVAAYWWPGFERIGEWFLPWHAERARGAQVLVEARGEVRFDVDGVPVRLSARADRLEVDADGAIHVVDYKTGQPPGVGEVWIGFAPQLTLTAAIAMAGGFREVGATPKLGSALYVKLSLGKAAPDVSRLDPKNLRGDIRKSAPPLHELAPRELANFRRRLGDYLAGRAAFRSWPFPKYVKSYGEYDHLARVAEWSVGAEGGDEGGGSDA